MELFIRQHELSTDTIFDVIWQIWRKEVLVIFYCVLSPHAIPFLRNKIHYSMLKSSKHHVVWGNEGGGGGGGGGV